MNKKEIAVYGGGCFWCMEAVFQNLKGVSSVISGYAGGDRGEAKYDVVSSGVTKHAEVIEITFDPEEISYETLLDIFWNLHDPTTLNRQGADVGTQYRSVVFYTTPEQKETALNSKERAKDLYPDPIVTEISELEEFTPAEKYHQNYYNNNKGAPYCSTTIGPKIAKMKEKYSHLLAQ